MWVICVRVSLSEETLERTMPSYFCRPARSVGSCGGSTTVTSMFCDRSAPASDCAWLRHHFLREGQRRRDVVDVAPGVLRGLGPGEGVARVLPPVRQHHDPVRVPGGQHREGELDLLEDVGPAPIHL